MIYFKKNDNNIEKYKINFNKEEIIELKKKIIDDCSFIKHNEYKSDYSPRFTSEIIKNFRCISTGETKEYFEETRNIYLYIFDEYKPPYLVDLIDQLLNGDSNAINKILNYDISCETNIDDQINIVNQEINEISYEDISKKKDKIKELEDLLKDKKLNMNQKNIEPYYKRLMELINFDLIDSISISELEKIESFFEMENKPFIKEFKIN